MAAVSTGPLKLSGHYPEIVKVLMRLFAIPSLTMASNFSATTLSFSFGAGNDSNVGFHCQHDPRITGKSDCPILTRRTGVEL